MRTTQCVICKKTKAIVPLNVDSGFGEPHLICLVCLRGEINLIFPARDQQRLLLWVMEERHTETSHMSYGGETHRDISYELWRRDTQRHLLWVMEERHTETSPMSYGVETHRDISYELWGRDTQRHLLWVMG
jgi:hypothetical protein